MPLIYESSYSKRPFPLYNSYLETLIPYFTTKVCQVAYTRERLELQDGDFLDLDWVYNRGEKLVILSHGFEGNSKDHFIEKTCAYLTGKGYDVLIWHYRSCGGELNRLPRLYHHGDIEDLGEVIAHAKGRQEYKTISLIGFSMGGNLVINYLGSLQSKAEIDKAIVFSTPLNLKKSNEELQKGFNKIIQRNFFAKFRKKVEKKQTQFPNLISWKLLDQCKSLSDLLERIVLPLSGFHSLADYYDRWSSLQFLPNIKVPLLIVNAQNDPLLSPGCYPKELAEKSKNIYLEAPKYGGHMGFTKRANGELWYVWRIAAFLKESNQ